MLQRLDHLVIAVPDPDAAASELEARVGLACTGGGRHPLWGTWNRLAWFGDTYVELIGLFDRSLAPNGAVSTAVMAALDAGRPGLVSYAVATDDADADLARLREAGSDLLDVESRGRTRPDGEVVRWRAAFPPRLGPSEPPFIVEHEMTGSEWGDAARRERAGLVHPVGGPARITALDLPVDDLEATASACESSVGMAFDFRGEGVAVASIGPQEVRLRRRTAADHAVVEIRVRTPLGSGGEHPASNAQAIEAVGVEWRVRVST